MKSPNILLLTIDTLRADAVSCYRRASTNGRHSPLNVDTPHIDHLAAGGVRFEQAITGGSWTQAAFPVILTSTYASMFGGCLGPLATGRPSPIEALANAGYVTGGFSTSPLLGRTYGYQRGFDEFVELEPGESDLFLRRIKGGQRLLQQPLTHAISARLGLRTRPSRMYVSAAELTDRLCHWLDGVQQPFFAWAHYMDVHWPYHREETLTEPQEIAQAWRDMRHMHGANWKGRTVTADQHAHYLRLYEEAVQYTDTQLGRLFAYLKAAGREDDTVVILLSDHGEEFFERRHWGHFESNLHDEILNVPLIIRLPSSPIDHEPIRQVVQRQVRLLDVMPTILDLCNCDPQDGLEGSSLVPLWDGREGYDEAGISISEMWRDQWQIVAIRTEAFKYIWDSRHPERPQLFDLQADPEERRDVCEAFPLQARQFQAILEAHLRRVAAQPEISGPIAQPALDDPLVRRLRALGYLE